LQAVWGYDPEPGVRYAGLISKEKFIAIVAVEEGKIERAVYKVAGPGGVKVNPRDGFAVELAVDHEGRVVKYHPETGRILEVLKEGGGS